MVSVPSTFIHRIPGQVQKNEIPQRSAASDGNRTIKKAMHNIFTPPACLPYGAVVILTSRGKGSGEWFNFRPAEHGCTHYLYKMAISPKNHPLTMGIFVYAMTANIPMILNNKKSALMQLYH
jgi:hypothetical protein